MTDAARAFDRHARAYDAARRRLIPCFDDFYGAAVGLLPFTGDAAPRILDLGAGTGLLSAMVAYAFPASRLTLVDAAPAMIEQARERFAGRDGVEFLVADYSRALPTGRFDAVVSALSIHHLADPDKRRLCALAFEALEPGGIFVNAEQVLAPTPALAQRDRDQWRAGCRAKGATDDDLAGADDRMRHDIMAPLADQLEWLREAGFTDVDVSYKNGWFAVFSGRKPA